jgi:foldase protein PrsA
VSKALRTIPALSAVLFAVVGLSACGGGVPSNAVVKVGDTPITKSTFNHWLAVAAASTASSTGGAKPVIPQPPNYTACIAHAKAIAPKPAAGQTAPTEAQLKAQCESQYQALKQEVLSFLLSSQWVIGEGSDLGVNISDSEVKKRFETIKSQQFPKAGEFEKFLASSGQTVSDLLLRVKLNLLSSKIQQKIIKSKGTPTQAQIEKYYKENPQRFGTPEKRNLKIILTKTEAEALKAKQELEAGKSFASVAKAVSIDPTTKANGGVLVGVVKGQEEASLDKAVFSSKTNVLGGPVKTAFGYYIYEVTSITPGSQQTLAQAQATIKQQLAATQQQAALTAFVKEFKKKWTGRTDCASGYVVMDCKQYKTPKTSTTPAPIVPQTSTSPTTTTSTSPTTTTKK